MIGSKEPASARQKIPAPTAEETFLGAVRPD